MCSMFFFSEAAGGAPAGMFKKSVGREIWRAFVFGVYFWQLLHIVVAMRPIVASVSQSLASIFALIGEKLAAAMPRQEDLLAANEQPEWGSQAAMQGALGGAQG